MLHEPEMECTCDGDGCHESVMLTMNYCTSGYDLRDADADRQLVNDHDWTVVDGQHYCSPECVPNAKPTSGSDAPSGEAASLDTRSKTRE